MSTGHTVLAFAPHIPFPAHQRRIFNNDDLRLSYRRLDEECCSSQTRLAVKYASKCLVMNEVVLHAAFLDGQCPSWQCLELRSLFHAGGWTIGCGCLIVQTAPAWHPSAHQAVRRPERDDQCPKTQQALHCQCCYDHPPPCRRDAAFFYHH